MRAGEKLKARREQRGWTGDQLASKLGLSAKSYISKMERGFAPITSKQRQKLAAIFNCSPEDFQDDVPSGIDMATMTPTFAAVPVLGRVSAERFSFSFEAIPEETLPNPYPGKKIFALRISGDCMEPTFHDGDLIFLSETSVINDGDIVLAHLDGEWTLKRYFKKADGVLLKPDNPKYEARKYASNKLTVRAKVLPYAMRRIS